MVAIMAVLVLLPAAVDNEPTSDLVIQDIAWSPTNPSAGETVTFTVTIKNQGSGDAGPSTIEYYVDGFYKGYDPVSSITAGGTATKHFTWSAEPGNHSIRAVVSYSGSVPESDETNNESEIILEIL
jgi:subtilase family serine protease